MNIDTDIPVSIHEDPDTWLLSKTGLCNEMRKKEGVVKKTSPMAS